MCLSVSASLWERRVFRVHPRCSPCQGGLHSFSWLCNIPSHRLLLIHPTFYGHLSHFLFLVLVSGAANDHGGTLFS